MNRTTVLLVSVALVSLALAFPFALAAQDAVSSWPSRPVHHIVPSEAGGAGDIVVRIINQRLSEKLGQQFITDNRPGAGGVVGVDALARATPDGYTIGQITASTQAAAPVMKKRLPYDPIKSFMPVSLTGSLPYVLAVNPRLPVKNLADLVALAKTRPNALSSAAFGTSSIGFLASILFAVRAGVEFNQVPYRSTAQAMLDVVEGRVDMQFGTIAPTLPLIRAGRLRALGVTSLKRSPSLPDVPTISEALLPGYEAVLWQAIAVPAGTPTAIVTRLNREVREILAEPRTIAANASAGVVAESSSPEQLAARILTGIATWREVTAKAGIQPE